MLKKVLKKVFLETKSCKSIKALSPMCYILEEKTRILMQVYALWPCYCTGPLVPTCTPVHGDARRHYLTQNDGIQ